ncbi:MAG: TrkH family potassium uptake protein [Cellvibrionaceae bacterium]|nr:TrkH family potassium uptake protein [Cellvibrionaceae bacterium]MCV6626980.1 TrkH family potassium uptake protein [Cellvibrionaceae bacterium]
MHFSVIFRVLGILLMLFSMTLLPPIFVSLYYSDESLLAFVMALGIIFCTGFLVWLPSNKTKHELRTRDGFLITVLFWFVLGVAGCLPFILSEHPGLSFTDAMFESLSGLTTTGATVISGLDDLPRSILYYRQQLQWLGGIGIIVIAVAILPMLGIGGMQLYRAETPGPVKDSKLTPRITETAKVLFLIYCTLTTTCALSYWAAGMSLFDAIGHAYSTVAIGGFSTHDASMGYFDSPLVFIVCMIFMVLSGVNFALHFYTSRNRSIAHYWQDPEFKFYIACLAVGIPITVGYLAYTDTYDFETSAIHGSFEFISILTTTGFGTADFSIWPSFLPFFIFLFAFMGGCAGSTGGGIKVIRVLLICKQGIREIKRLINPNAVIPIKLNQTSVADRVVEAVWGFFAVFIICYMIMFILLMATGLDFLTAVSAVGACITNLGPGMGDVALNYADINNPAKWILCFAMLLGRLEIFTLLVLFSPSFWRR